MATKKKDLKHSGNAIISLANCAQPSGYVTVEKQLRKIQGINEAIVDHAAHVLVVNFDSTRLTAPEIRNLITTLSHDRSPQKVK
ncbi:MAG: heavy-metal-associated domain-containing protein [Candidatus Bathyarchaeia archaeon]